MYTTPLYCILFQEIKTVLFIDYETPAYYDDDYGGSANMERLFSAALQAGRKILLNNQSMLDIASITSFIQTKKSSVILAQHHLSKWHLTERL